MKLQVNLTVEVEVPDNLVVVDEEGIQDTYHAESWAYEQIRLNVEANNNVSVVMINDVEIVEEDI